MLLSFYCNRFFYRRKDVFRNFFQKQQKFLSEPACRPQRPGQYLPEFPKYRQQEPAERQKIERRPCQTAYQHGNAELPVPEAKRKQQVSRQPAQDEPEIRQRRQPAQIPPQSAQKIIMQAAGQSHQGSQQKAAPLQPQRLLHSAKQSGKEAALLLRLLVQQRVYRAVHRDLPALDGKRLQVQRLSADHRSDSLAILIPPIREARPPASRRYYIYAAGGILFRLQEILFGVYSSAGSSSDSSTRPWWQPLV